jgi:nucleoside-diphosphate-sugar epimerase
LPSYQPSEIPSGGEFVIGSETDGAAVKALLDDADALVHLGRPDLPAKEDLCQTELASLAVLIPAVHERGIKLHFLSSSEVFTPPPEPSPAPLDEQASVAPSSPLGVAKVMWEQTLQIWGEHKGLRYAIFRVPTVVPEYLVYNSVSARYLRAGFKTGESFPHAHDAGKRWGTCYVHAEDVAGLIAGALGRSEAIGETFHVAADEWISEHELAEISYRVLCDFMIPCKWRPPSASTPTGLVGDVWLDNRKAKGVLNLDVANSIARLATKLRLWVDDFASTARLRVARQ